MRPLFSEDAFRDFSDDDDGDLADDDRRHDPLADAIVRRIENATCGHVSGLYVGRLGGSIVLHGYCRTYRSRELAHQAALDMADDSVPLIDLLTVS